MDGDPVDVCGCCSRGRRYQQTVRYPLACKKLGDSRDNARLPSAPFASDELAELWGSALVPAYTI
ncbi:hypothetical protein BFJ63_vAg18641 [Fusarium oxysporum f. sp. narcissi]|uniref:Uncharacterized protein n=1 Tax=Fusarium oxysporum f. sp. narcissi TaxID=451672 RepID=A0A4Q2V3T5_FUSOX|nr:hypothetical protein BFJ63_vAg18641 [Fusarium oxysporum f. sp. narcissi]